MFLRELLLPTQDLKADTDILIVRADKGNANVVMNRSEYEKQLEEMLMDRNTYAKITDRRRNPTTKTERDLQTMLKTWFDLGHLKTSCKPVALLVSYFTDKETKNVNRWVIHALGKTGVYIDWCLDIIITVRILHESYFVYNHLGKGSSKTVYHLVLRPI